MSAVGLNGSVYSNLLEQTQNTGTYICKNSQTGEQKVFTIDKGFVPQTFRDIILDGYSTKEDLKCKPAEARKVINLLTQKLNKKKAKEENFFISLINKIYDYIRNIFGGLGFKSTFDLAEELIAELETKAATITITTTIPDPVKPKEKPKREKVIIPNPAPSTPKPISRPSAPSTPKPISRPLIPPIEVPNSPSVSDRKKAFQENQKQTQNTPRTPLEKKVNIGSRTKPVLYPKYRDDYANFSDDEKNAMFKDFFNRARVVKSTLTSEESTLYSDIVSKCSEILDPEFEFLISFERLAREIKGQEKFDKLDIKEEKVYRHIVLDVLKFCRTNDADLALMKWLEQQEGFDIDLFKGCLSVFIDISCERSECNVNALKHLFKIYNDKNWIETTPISDEIISNDLFVLLLADRYLTNEKEQNMFNSFIHHRTFTFSTFLKLAGCYMYKMDAARAEFNTKDVEYKGLNDLMKIYNEKEWKKLFDSNNANQKKAVKFILPFYTSNKMFSNKKEDELFEELAAFIKRKAHALTV